MKRIWATSVIDKMHTLSETKLAHLIENGIAALGTSKVVKIKRNNVKNALKP